MAIATRSPARLDGAIGHELNAGGCGCVIPGADRGRIHAAAQQGKDRERRQGPEERGEAMQ